MPRFLFILLLLALVYVLQHFLLSLAWGAVLAIATWPAVRWLMTKRVPQAAAVGLVLVALIVGFGMPAIGIVSSLKTEVAALSSYIHHINRTGLPVPDWLASLPVGTAMATEWWNQYLAAPGAVTRLIGELPGSSLALVTGKVSTIGAMVLSNAFYIFLALLTQLILQLNARRILEHLDAAGGQLFARSYPVLKRLLPVSIRGTALGLCSVAALEGVVLGVAYAIAGAPMPVMLGILTGYMALIPGGAPLSFLSVSALLFAQGNTIGAVGLAVWGCVELFLVDKFVRPRIIGESVNLPFLAVLFGLLGGISTMGMIGLFVGPFLVALLFHYLRELKSSADLEVF